VVSHAHWGGAALVKKGLLTCPWAPCLLASYILCIDVLRWCRIPGPLLALLVRLLDRCFFFRRGVLKYPGGPAQSKPNNALSQTPSQFPPFYIQESEAHLAVRDELREAPASPPSAKKWQGGGSAALAASFMPGHRAYSRVRWYSRVRQYHLLCRAIVFSRFL
jgi:hypothetical protein